jgi:hypothetical protein
MLHKVIGGPGPEVCPNCGAPWQPDAAGACPWCHTRPRPRTTWPGEALEFLDDQASLVPGDVDNSFTLPTFVKLMLTMLSPVLSREPVVQEYIARDPALLQQIRALSTAVSAAGVRVRDAGVLKDDSVNLKVYTPGEIWLFDLAVDVIAMLGGLPGLPSAKRALISSDVSSLDYWVNGHTWKKELKRAGEGPPEFQELRARVPHHPVRPAK